MSGVAYNADHAKVPSAMLVTDTRPLSQLVRCRLCQLQAWTALGRLYAEAEGGVGHALAATCYLQARSSDPLYAQAWEGMAVMAGTRATGVWRDTR